MTQPREVSESVTKRVVDEFRRTGIVPPELVRHIQASAWKRGSTVTRDQVERYAREWVNSRLEAEDRKEVTVRHVDDAVERCIETLATSSPTQDPAGWATAVARVEAAWRAGELTAGQMKQLDVINERYDQKAG